MTVTNSPEARAAFLQETKLSALLRMACDDFEWCTAGPPRYGMRPAGDMRRWLGVGYDDDGRGTAKLCSVCLGGSILWRRGFVGTADLEDFTINDLDPLQDGHKRAVPRLEAVNAVRTGDLSDALILTTDCDWDANRTRVRDEDDYVEETAEIAAEELEPLRLDLVNPLVNPFLTPEVLTPEDGASDNDGPILAPGDPRIAEGLTLLRRYAVPALERLGM